MNRDVIATFYPGGEKGYTYYPSMGSEKKGNFPVGCSGTGTGIFHPGREKDRLMPVSFTPQPCKALAGCPDKPALLIDGNLSLGLFCQLFQVDFQYAVLERCR